jgi:hypothetical protein
MFPDIGRLDIGRSLYWSAFTSFKNDGSVAKLIEFFALIRACAILNNYSPPKNTKIPFALCFTFLYFNFIAFDIIPTN